MEIDLYWKLTKPLPVTLISAEYKSLSKIRDFNGV
jgi:hypothetical protein